MINTVKNGIIYFSTATILTAALITIRPVAKPSPEATASPPIKQVAADSQKNDVPTLFELKLIDKVLYYNAYSAGGAVYEQKTIDYIDIYSLYPEQSASLQEGIFFESRESVAEYIQDLGS